MKLTDDATSGVSSDRLAGLRPAWEAVPACLALAAASAAALQTAGPWGLAAGGAMLGLFALRARQAWKVVARRIPLAGFAPDFITFPELVALLRERASSKEHAVSKERPSWAERWERGRLVLSGSVLTDAASEGARIRSLWLGRGFEWTPSHAQALYELTASPVEPLCLPERLRRLMHLPKPLRPGDIGSPLMHGIGADQEDDIFRPLTGLGGGTLIVGTTQAGKGVMLTSLIAQAIFRGEPVIVIDPKSSKRLRGAVAAAARAAGRAAPLEFHPAFPEEGVRLDPLGAWSRPSELATRIAAVLPPDSGAFGSFAWMAVNVAVEGLFYVTERPSLLALRRIIEGGIDPLLEKALAKSFADMGIDDWRRRVTDMDKRDIRPPSPQSSPELTAAVLLWESLAQKRRDTPGAAVIGGLISVFRHNREHYSKITASLQPVLAQFISTQPSCQRSLSQLTDVAWSGDSGG